MLGEGGDAESGCGNEDEEHDDDVDEISLAAVVRVAHRLFCVWHDRYTHHC